MSLSTVLRTRRKELGLTLNDIAQHMGVSEATVQRWESGNIKSLRQGRVAKLADILNVSPAKLMGWESDDQLPTNAMPYSPTQRIPILGRISAGLPLYAEEQIEGYTYTDLNHGGEYFALRVKGDSMNAARINENDLLIVRKQDMVEEGEIAVVMAGEDEATVKCWHRHGNIVMLEPKSTNPEHQMQIYDLRKTPIRIIGKVVQNQIAY